MEEEENKFSLGMKPFTCVFTLFFESYKNVSIAAIRKDVRVIKRNLRKRKRFTFRRPRDEVSEKSLL